MFNNTQSLVKNNGKKFETILVRKCFRSNGDIELKTNDGKTDGETWLIKKIENTSNRYWNLCFCDNDTRYTKSYNNKYSDNRSYGRNDKSSYDRYSRHNSYDRYSRRSSYDEFGRDLKPGFTDINDIKLDSKFDTKDNEKIINETIKPINKLFKANKTIVTDTTNTNLDISKVSKNKSSSTLLKKRKMIDEESEDGELPSLKKSKEELNKIVKDSTIIESSNKNDEVIKAATKDNTVIKSATKDNVVKSATKEDNTVDKNVSNVNSNIVVDNQTISMSSETYAKLMKMIETYSK